jgi:hypothetical protein
LSWSTKTCAPDRRVILLAIILAGMKTSLYLTETILLNHAAGFGGVPVQRGRLN